MPIELLDIKNLPANMTRAEREYLAFRESDESDPSKQHHIIVDVFANNTYVPARLYEPSDAVLRSILSEFVPLWQRAHVDTFCTCELEYRKLQNAISTLESAVCTYQVTTETLAAIKEAVPRTVYQRMKALAGQTFYSMQEAADAMLLSVLEQKQVAEHGMTLMNALKETGVNEAARESRLRDLERVLAKFYGNVPTKPYPATHDPCPYCHRPFQYSFMDLVSAERDALQRIRTLLVGEYPLAASSLPRVIAAMEAWIFTEDSDVFVKKNTMTATMLKTLKTWWRNGITALQTSFDSTSSAKDDSTASASSSSDVPPPPPVNVIPGDN